MSGLVQSELTAEQVERRLKAQKKFTYRGVDMDKLLEMSNTELMELCNSTAVWTDGRMIDGRLALL